MQVVFYLFEKVQNVRVDYSRGVFVEIMARKREDVFVGRMNFQMRLQIFSPQLGNELITKKKRKEIHSIYS